jgi:uncharacterized cupin superfamily protein
LSVVKEARLSGQPPAGRAPEGSGWFVLNAADARWLNGAFGTYTRFEGDENDARFSGLGINIAIVAPGQPSSLYHAESAQEDFLVLAGECLLIVEGQERPLRQWDFVHCPSWTEHAFVGAGPGPCVVLAVGRRPSEAILYPVSGVAQRYGAGVERGSRDSDEAYATVPPDVPATFTAGLLPGT